MARRTKKQQRQFEEMLKAFLGLIAIGAYLLTKDVFITAFAVVFAIIIIIGITIYQIQRKREKIRKSGITEIDAMDGIEFEHYLKELFISQGYKAEVTKAAGDYGADLILYKQDKKIVVQAKRYSNNVGIKAVQEIVAAKGYYNATDAWVVTNSDYTKAAYNLAEKSNVLLINRENLIDRILMMNPKAVQDVKIMKQQLEEEKNSVCNRCGGIMLMRDGKRGAFYCCSNFPKCRNTQSVG